MPIPTLALPHAGGAAHQLRPVGEASSSLTLIPHDYPGHGRRVREPLLTSLEAMAEDALARFAPHMKQPYALFGHSMGARVAFLAAQMAEKAHRGPSLVVVSGAPAPGHGDEREIARLPDDQLIGELQSLGGLPPAVVSDPLLLEFVVPILRADLLATERGRDLDGVLVAPLVALHGASDGHDRASAAAWAEHTSGPFIIQVIEGGHFFHLDSPSETAAAIDRVVDALSSQRSTA